MTAFRKFTRAEDIERERITRRCGDETARSARGLTTVGNSPCRWWTRLEAFDADQILACVLSIGSPTLRHAAPRRATPRHGAARSALVNPIEYSITAGQRGTGVTYIHTYVVSQPDSFEMKLSALPQCTLRVTNVRNILT